ncbi:hypothetical protein MBLNU459_g1197t1 [Dothideomycetes sp. NU459]
MTSATPAGQTQPIAASTANAASTSASGTSSPLTAVPAQLPGRSYASATKTFSQAANQSSSGPSVAGAAAPSQHGKESAVNGKTSGNMQNGDHGRKPSVIISASGTTGQIPNGGPVGQSSRPNISFGSMNGPQGSPAIASSVPHQVATPSLTPGNPRITSPAHSPSPIPQPAASGGKPPSTLPGQSNGLSFGSMGAENGDGSNRGPVAQAPLTPSAQPVHLRRESSQSAHSDMSNAGMQRGFVPPNGRGRGGYMGPNFAPHSPAQNYRQPPAQQRGGPNMPPQFQGQAQMGQSPYRGSRSPAMMHAQPFMPQGMQNPQMHYGAHPQHLNPQQQVNTISPSSSAETTPFSSSHQKNMTPVRPSNEPSSIAQKNTTPVQPSNAPGSIAQKNTTSTQQSHVPPSSNDLPDFSSDHAAFDQYLTHVNSQQAFYGAQPPYDPNAAYYQPYYPQQYYGAPPSPRPGQQYPVPYGGPPQYMQSPQHPMSRSGSQISERPGSSVGQPAASAPSNVSQGSHTPAPSTPTPSTSSFQIPPKTKSKAIVIKNDKGEEVTFGKKPSPAPAAVPQSPAIVSSSAPTPPPRTPSVQHNRAESKTATETKNEFQEQVKRKLEAEREAEKAKEDAEKKAAKDKEDAESKAAKDKEDAESKAAKDKEEADAKAVKDKQDADAKAAKDKEEADAKALKEKEEAEAASKKAAADKAAAEEAEKAEKAAAEAKAKEEADKAKAKAEADAVESEADSKAREQREEDERIEREIAEMEELERLEEERERAFQEKRNKQKAEQAAKDKEAAAKADEEMKRLEREAEELELKRERERENPVEQSAEDKAEAEKLFASLKKPTVGPGATEGADDADVPASEDSAATPKTAAKPKPAALKLETSTPVEPAQPTAGMQSLKSARFLEVKNDAISYPSGIKSPNPALNQDSKRVGKEYDMDFLLQFQNIFKEKPTVDWDQRVKDTLGDGEPGSARPSGGRGGSSMGGRAPSGRGAGAGAAPAFGAMGSFGNTRTLPPGTSSQDRFNASNAQRNGMSNPLAAYAGRPGGFPVGGPQSMSRGPSMQGMGSNSPKVGGSSRRGGGSKRGPSHRNDREEADKAKNMPLTAGMELKALEKSTTGWKPTSIGAPVQAVDLSGHMAPDMVQRKVKAALNKMTPENFEKISDQIMTIANQSKNEKDGRTLRQVIQLTFEKACDEAHWAGTYAKFCSKMLTSMSNEIVDETIRDRNNQPVVGGGLFRKYLLNRCQEEFERGWEANLPDKPEGSSQEAALLSDEYYIAAAAKRRGLGLIQFIGELYKLGMLTVKIMHQCVLRLLNFEGQPDESAVENLSKLLKAVGATMDSTEQGHQLVNIYYDRVQNIMENHKDMPSRSRFMLMDIVDLRKGGWKSKDADKGPKTIEQIHAEAEAAQAAAELERQKNTGRGGGGGGRMPMGRGDARSFSGAGGMPPPDYPRNQVGMDDLRRLQNRGTSGRQASQGLGPNLGPSSLFNSSRSNSGRKGLGPPRDGETSGPSSRSATPSLQKKEEPSTHANAFSALAGLDGEGAEGVGGTSEAGSPPVSKAQPASIDEKAASSTDNA